VKESNSWWERPTPFKEPTDEIGAPIRGKLPRTLVHNFLYSKGQGADQEASLRMYDEGCPNAGIANNTRRDGILGTGGSYFQWVGDLNESPTKNPAVRAAFRAYPAAIATSLGFCYLKSRSRNGEWWASLGEPIGPVALPPRRPRPRPWRIALFQWLLGRLAPSRELFQGLLSTALAGDDGRTSPPRLVFLGAMKRLPSTVRIARAILARKAICAPWPSGAGRLGFRDWAIRLSERMLPGEQCERYWADWATLVW